MKKSKAALSGKLTVVGKCINCQKEEILTAEQIKNAATDGAALSTCCFFPMVVVKAKVETNKIK